MAEIQKVVKAVSVSHHFADRVDGGFSTVTSENGTIYVRWQGRYGATTKLVPLAVAQLWEKYEQLDKNAVSYEVDWEMEVGKIYSSL